MGDSNCKIRFNLPQRDKLEVSKVLGNKVDNDADLGTLLQQTFKFQLLVSDTKDGEYKPCASKEYDLYNGNNNNGTTSTDNDGYFTLGFGERAIFDKYNEIESEKYYKVIETSGDNYTTSWTSTVNGQQNTTQDDKNNPIIQTLRQEATEKKIIAIILYLQIHLKPQLLMMW